MLRKGPILFTALMLIAFVGLIVQLLMLKYNSKDSLMVQSSWPLLDIKNGSDKFHHRANATFFSLVRNRELKGMLRSVRSVERRFNAKFHYDWVFLNNEPFNDNFVSRISNEVSGTAHFGIIDENLWTVPSWIDEGRFNASKAELVAEKVLHGGETHYRHMCRYFSGFFYDHALLTKYKYYWRVEPKIELKCDVPYDVFSFCANNGIDYGFAVSRLEYHATIPSLWATVRNFTLSGKARSYLAANSLLQFVSSDLGESYNRCHFWSNFEVGNLDFFRGNTYREYFKHLDMSGGFYYERWGDAPVHSIAASLFLNRTQVHYFDDIGYSHRPLTNCPTNAEVREKLNCDCSAEDNFTWRTKSCTPRFYDVIGADRPAEWIFQTEGKYRGAKPKS